MALPNLTTPYPGSGTATDYCNAVPQMPFDDSKEYSTQVIFFEDDASQAYKGTAEKHREIVLSYQNQSDTEKASFEAFWDARLGSYELFYFNNARTGETDTKVRFKDSKVKFTVSGSRTWNWTVTIKRVL